MYVNPKRVDPSAAVSLALGHSGDRRAIKDVTAPADRDGSQSKRDFTQGHGQHADAQLLIEQDEVAGSFVYKIVDADSGEIIRQFPQEQLLEVMEFFKHNTGVVIDRRV